MPSLVFGANPSFHGLVNVLYVAGQQMINGNMAWNNKPAATEMILIVFWWILIIVHDLDEMLSDISPKNDNLSTHVVKNL